MISFLTPCDILKIDKKNNNIVDKTNFIKLTLLVRDIDFLST